MKTISACSTAEHPEPFYEVAKWFLVICGIYYAWLFYHSFVYLLNGLDNKVDHSSIQDLQSGWKKCFSIWNGCVHVYFYFSINMNNALAYLFKTSAFVENVILPYQKFLEQAFLSVIFPLTLSVCIVFWYVYFLDRNLIYPTDVEDIIPVWFNHCLHTIPVIIVFLHLVVVEPKSKPLGMKSSMCIQSGIHGIYLAIFVPSTCTPEECDPGVCLKISCGYDGCWKCVCPEFDRKLRKVHGIDRKTMLSYYHHIDGYWLYVFMESHTTSLLLICVNFPLYVLVLPCLLTWIGYSLLSFRQKIICR